MPDYIKGDDRGQALLLPARLDDYVGPDNPVRAIDAFVAGLDMDECGFARAEPGRMGRPGYDPRDMLRLYLYGYGNRLRSSRALEKAAQVNLEVIWLMRGLRPDFKTIADFRRDSAGAFKAVFRKFVQLCREAGLVGGETVAIDGTKLKAVSSPDAAITATRLERVLAKADEDLAAYLAQLADADAREKGGQPLDREALAARIESLRAEIEHAIHLKEELERSGLGQLGGGDPDSRAAAGSRRVAVGYNAQAAADELHGLVVAQDLCSDVTDIAQLAPMAEQAAEALGEPEGLNVVADKGYAALGQMAQVEDAGMRCHLPARSQGSGRLYAKDAFMYLEFEDAYLCPAGKVLPAHSQSVADGDESTLYRNPEACAACPIRAKCTTARDGRSITRQGREDVLEAVAARMAEEPEVYRRRAPTVEKLFGSVKWSMGCECLLLKGLAKCRGEWSLMCCCYNFRRAVSLLGARGLIAFLQTGKVAAA